MQALRMPLRIQFLFTRQELNAYNILRCIQHYTPCDIALFNSELIFLEGIPSFHTSHNEIIDPIFYLHNIQLDNGVYILTASLPNNDKEYDREDDYNITIQISTEGHFLSMTGVSNFGVEFTLTPADETAPLLHIREITHVFNKRMGMF